MSISPSNTIRRRRDRVLAAASALLFTATLALPSSTSAQQASWIKTTGTSCASQSTYISFSRWSGGNCYTNRAFGADANLRTSGSDTYNDGFFVGTQPGATPNTDEVYNRWSINVNLCRNANFVTHRNTLSPGTTLFVSNTNGLMSYRGSACT